MACCYVEITGKDGNKHVLHDRCGQRLRRSAEGHRYMVETVGWDSAVVAIVRRDDESWNISVHKVIEKASARFRQNR
jgi:hypothetical protein